ncbi:MAG: D-amino acid dehydrogenase [Stellaceae bacterium]
MRSVVLGAGVAGVTAAYELAKRGHAVTVVDRQPGPALETSFANGGLVVPSQSDPWASPDAPMKLLKWLGREDAPLLLRLSALPGMTRWGLAFLANCRRDRWHRNTAAVFGLAIYSRDAYDALARETGIEHGRSDKGTLRLYSDEAALEAGLAEFERYRELGLAYDFLTREQCVALEPSLTAAARKFVGGIHVAADRSGDCHAFTTGLAGEARKLGVEFRFETKITGIETNAGAATAVLTDKGRIAADRFLLALGPYSAGMARSLGWRLPVNPVKGYSETIDIAGWNNAPRIPLVITYRKMAITNLGQHLRLAGSAEFAGFDLRLNVRRGQMLLDALDEHYPDYPRASPPRHWAGLRPVVPDGRPVLGATPIGNLFVDTGHGQLGWTLACGSAKAVAAVMDGKPPDIDLRDFAFDRF